MGSDKCLVCGAALEYSVVAIVRRYCHACTPDSCPECGCVNISQRQNHVPDPAAWECDNGCFFELS